MAKKRPLIKGNRPKSAVRGGVLGTVSRLFCKRSIIIISDHKTQHVPFSARTQFLMGMAALGFIVWGSFSGGSYMAAQRELHEKEQKLANFANENARVEAEFSLLKQDLVKLADGEKGKTAEAAKEMVEQYDAKNAGQPSPATTSSEAESKYNVVFNRITQLENKVKELQSTHDTMMADIRATTGGKIKELERVIARTGMDSAPLTRAAEAKRLQDEQTKEKYGRTNGMTQSLPASAASAEGGPFIPAKDAPAKPAAPATKPDGQGGPFIPASTSTLSSGGNAGSLLKEKDTELYFNLRRLMTLNDVVNAMPLVSPIPNDDYHQTSGFGTRVDPFRGALSFHAGVDLAGETGTKVLATNDGRIDFAGWKTAYGNVVDVKHEYGFSTRYGHLRSILVRPGQVVRKGQVIGIQGSTGRSTGEHVHYEVRYNDNPLNPANFLKAGQDVQTN